MCGRAGSATQTGITTAADSPLSCSEDSRSLKGPVADLVRESQVYLKAAGDGKAQERMHSQGGKGEVSPTIIPDPENRRQKEKEGKKNRSSFYYIYIQQNFARNNPYCTVRALGG